MVRRLDRALCPPRSLQGRPHRLLKFRHGRTDTPFGPGGAALILLLLPSLHRGCACGQSFGGGRNLDEENQTMKRSFGAIIPGLSAIFALLTGPGFALSAIPQLSSIQGAWLQQSSNCADVYTTSRQAIKFKQEVNEFVPGFIVSGNRLKTPVNTCRIVRIVPAGKRWTMKLGCTGSVSTMGVSVQFSLTSDGALLRYLNDQDATGSRYQRCAAGRLGAAPKE